MAYEKFQSLEGSLAGFVDRVILKDNPQVTTVEPHQPGDKSFFFIKTKPYKRDYTFWLPDEPLNEGSVTTVEFDLSGNTAEKPPSEAPYEHLEAIAINARYYAQEMKALQKKLYHGVMEVPGEEDIVRTIYKLPTPTEMHVRQVLTDFLLPENDFL